MTVTKSDLPELQGASLHDAKSWFEALRPHSSGAHLPGWHADDGFEGGVGFSADAAAAINDTVSTIFKNARAWPDSDVIYRLVAGEVVNAEAIWPGFVADLETGASRIGYVSLPQHPRPNFVIEEFNGEFYLLEFDAPVPMSACRQFTLSRLDGVAFQTGAASDSYLDVSAAEQIAGTEVICQTVDQIDEVIQSIHNATTPTGPRH